jgi:hypothetical protein
MVLVGLPPTPAAVVVLLVEQAPDARRHLSIDELQALGRRQLQLRERAGHDQRRQEGRERLLGAAIRIAGQEIERPEQRPRQRRRQGHLNRPGGGIRVRGYRKGALDGPRAGE